jgi:hypothetical protein
MANTAGKKSSKKNTAAVEPMTVSQILEGLKSGKLVTKPLGDDKITSMAARIKADSASSGAVIGTWEIMMLLRVAGSPNEQEDQPRDNPELIRIGKGLEKLGIVTLLPREKGDEYKWTIN